MSLRRQVLEVLQAVFGFGKIAKSSGHDVYDVDGEIGEATTPECERWGDAAVLSRPLAGAECKYIQLGDERVVIGTRDRRYTITVADGEVVVRAMGPGSPAYVRLRPNGDVQIVGANIHLGAESVATFVARADKVDQEITRIWNTLTSSTITPLPAAGTDGGEPGLAALLALATTNSGLAQSTASAKSRTQ